MAWHRKHRPHLVKELHLTPVREALEKLMTKKTFPQVFLFAGPKGTGKTSASRILGAMLNDPKNEEVVDALFFKKPLKKAKSLVDPDTDSDFSKRVYQGSSFVVQEMDAASHRGIDDVRALKERAMLPPQEGKITVYILDEAHMLTTEAFNALLKLLEEPPAHALFILATTELHKIPETIVSRSRHIPFRKATDEELTLALGSVLKKEKIEADADAIEAIVQRADGSFRDGVKILESVADDEKIVLETVEKILGKSVEPFLQDILQLVFDKDSTGVSSGINDLRQQKFSEKYVYKVLFSMLHKSLLQDLEVVEGKPLFTQKIARFLIQELLKANLDAFSPITFLSLEVKLLELIERAQQKSGGKTSLKTNTSKKKISKQVVSSKMVNKADVSVKEEAPIEEVDEFYAIESENLVSDIKIDEDNSESLLKTNKNNLKDNLPEEKEEKDEEEVFHLTEEIQGLAKILIEQWDRFLQVVQDKNPTVSALLRSSKPSINDTGMPEVSVYYQLHKEQLQQQKYMSLLGECVKDIVGSSLPLQVVLQVAPVKATLVEVENPSPQLSQLASEALM